MNIYGVNYAYQQFYLPVATTIDKVEFILYSGASYATYTTGQIAVRIYALSGAMGSGVNPTGSPLSSGYRNRSTIDDNLSTKIFDMDRVVLPIGNYAFQVENPIAISSTGITISRRASDVYANAWNSISANSGSTWGTNNANDFAFRIWVLDTTTVSGCTTGGGGGGTTDGLTLTQLAGFANTFVHERAVKYSAWALTGVIGWLFIKQFRWKRGM
jgi:hypothetical protein